MAMANKGLTKLNEELCELGQIAAKKTAYMDTDHHPDGESLKERMEDETADVLAAITFVVEKFDLNYKLRDVLIDYFKEVDTIPVVNDQRIYVE